MLFRLAAPVEEKDIYVCVVVARSPSETLAGVEDGAELVLGSDTRGAPKNVNSCNLDDARKGCFLHPLSDGSVP
jgi:hypothetical protein